MNGGRRTILAMGLWGALSAGPATAWADAPLAANAGTPAAVEAARVHFTKGKELYLAGAYHEAIAELEAARALDPKAKDLVFNLGIVHEKLGDIDDALRFLRLYVQMDLDPTEHARAENYIKRLEGAKTELDAKKAAAAALVAASANVQERKRGRIDVATIVAGTAAVGAAAAGLVFGVKALADQPPSSFVAGKDGSVQSLDSRQSSAHTEAIVADISFGGAIVAAAVAAGLYFGRYKDSAQAGGSAAPQKAAFLTIAPIGRSGAGGEVLFGGTF